MKVAYKDLPFKTDFGDGERMCEYCKTTPVSAKRKHCLKNLRFCSISCMAKEQVKRGVSGVQQHRNSPAYGKKYTCEFCGFEGTGHEGAQRWCSTCVPKGVRKWGAMAGTYHISKPQFEDMFRTQNGKCALCRKKATCIDHNHKNGRVRGLLCTGCNTKVGALEWDGAWLDRVRVYLRGNKWTSPPVTSPKPGPK